MLFAAICQDKPGHLEMRLAARADHLAFLEAHAHAVKLGGPFLDGEGRPIGSLLIIDCADLAAARELLARDPYAKAGLFASVELTPWRRTVGAEI
ncbi:MAG TPA: YciI family protein [Methylocystis sp.]|nr:YciI family protein [Methylocystis sp.]